MRITQSMLNTQMLRNLSGSNERIAQQQEMLSTEKKINKPSDDPIGISSVMRYKAQLSRIEQYNRNLGNAKSWIDITETAISNVNDVMQRVRELTVQGAHGSSSKAAKESIAIEVKQLKEELVKIANTKFNDNYIFNGQLTDKAPYDPSTTPTPDLTADNTDNIVLTVADGVTININTLGNDVFSDSSDSLFTIMDDLYNTLMADDSVGTSIILDRIDTGMQNYQDAWADVGARSKRLELIENRLGDAEENITELRSRTEDADVAAVITNLKMEENVQRAALATGARVLQPSLVDFLR